MSGIKINDADHRKQYSALMEELSDHDDLKVSMDCGDQWIGYNEKSKNMYVVLELPSHIWGFYVWFCLVARMEGGSAVIHYVATDEDGKEKIFDDYDELMEEDEEEETPWCYENNKKAICSCFEPCRLPDESDDEEDEFEDCECGYTHHSEDKCPNEATAKHYAKWGKGEYKCEWGNIHNNTDGFCECYDGSFENVIDEKKLIRIFH